MKPIPLLLHHFWLIVLISLLTIALPARADLIPDTPYRIYFSHNRDENELKQWLDYSFHFGQGFELRTRQNHEERYNATLQRQETRLNTAWQLEKMVLDSLWIAFKLNGSRIIDDREAGTFSAAYKSTTTRKNAATAFSYRPLTSLAVQAELGYDDDDYDRTTDTISPEDNGGYISGKLTTEFEPLAQVETAFEISSYRNNRDVRQNIEHIFSGRATYYSLSWLPGVQWQGQQSYSRYDFPSSTGLERRRINESDHRLALNSAPWRGLALDWSGHFSFSEVNYDSLLDVVSVDRKDYERTRYDTAFNAIYRWSDRLATAFSYTVDQLERDYRVSNINDVEILQQQLNGQMRFRFWETDSLRLSAIYDLVQHTYRDSNSHADRDVLSQSYVAAWSRIFRQVFRLALKAGFSETHLVNLSRFASANNHRSTTYQLIPEVAYVSPHSLRIVQSLEMNANYIIYDFADVNRINANDRLIRRFSYRADVQMPLGSKLRPRITYRYEPQDNGSYRYNPEHDQRLYQPGREQLTDVLAVELVYQMLPYVRFTPHYAFQESRLWSLNADERELVSSRRQESLGLRLDYTTHRVLVEAFATHISRADLPNYWHAECAMRVRF